MLNCNQYVLVQHPKHRSDKHGAGMEMADTFASLCKHLAYIFIDWMKQDLGKDSKSKSRLSFVYELISKLFDQSCQFYHQFGNHFNQKRGHPLSQEEADTESMIEWRKTIDVGSKVDYLFNNRWRHGIIKKINIVITDETLTSENFKVHEFQIKPHDKNIFNDCEKVDVISTNYDYHRFIYSDATRTRIAPPATKSIENRPHMTTFRQELNVGMKCDVKDTVHKWYVCTIIKVNEAKNQVFIHYDGWKEKYNEWIRRDDPRIQPALSVALGGKGAAYAPHGTIDKLLEPIIEDQEDPDDENVYAVWRVK